MSEDRELYFVNAIQFLSIALVSLKLANVEKDDAIDMITAAINNWPGWEDEILNKEIEATKFLYQTLEDINSLPVYRGEDNV